MDKWLWFARFFKTRTLAAKNVSEAGIRVNGLKVRKPSAVVRIGDTLTFAQNDDIRVVRITLLGQRRGPAKEAVMLYEDLQPVAANKPKRAAHPNASLSGRPTKKNRRDIEAFRRSSS